MEYPTKRSARFQRVGNRRQKIRISLLIKIAKAAPKQTAPSNPGVHGQVRDVPVGVVGT